MKNRIDNIKISSVEYFVMFLMVVSCGFPAGDIIPGKSFVIIGMGLLYLLHNKRRIGHNYKSLITMTLMIIVVYIAHYIQFGIYDNILMLKLLLSISGFFVCLIMGSKFRYAYLNIMAVFAGISLIFFLLQVSLQIVPTIGPLYSGTHFRGVFIWNTQPYAAWRNCGPFWEPGAYAGYLLLVFVLFFNDLKLLWDRHPIKVMIITIAFLTTFSTQGYLTAFLVLMSKLIVSMKGKNASRALMVSFCVLIASFFIYESAPFLREKVDTQIEEWADWDSDESLHYASRFTTTMVDLDIIGKNPFWGASNKAELKYQDFKYIQRVLRLSPPRAKEFPLLSICRPHAA